MSNTVRLLGIPSDDAFLWPERLGAKPVVLLARLVVEPRAVPRESLLTFLWPEKSETHARGSLRQALHAIRQVLGAEALVTTRHHVGLGSLPATDLREFLDAVRRSDDRRAVALYHGALLEQLTLTDASEAELWLDIERRRCARLYEMAAVRLLQSHPVALSPMERVHVATRLRDLDPEDAATWARLLECLRAAGAHDAVLAEQAALRARIAAKAIIDPRAAAALLTRGESPGGGAAPSGAREMRAGEGAVSRVEAKSSTPLLVGRDTELGELMDAWHTASTSGSSPVVLAGRAGVGKTRLLDVFARCLEQAGVPVVRARASRALQDSPLAFARQVTEPLLKRPGATALSHRHRRALAVLGPWDRPADGAAQSAASGRATSTTELAEALAALLRCLAGETPCVLLLDDLEWSDEPSRRVLHQAVAQTLIPHLLVVGVTRGAAAGEWPGWRVLRCGPLTSDDAARLLRAIATPLPDALQADCLRWSGGVPLLIEHTTRLIEEVLREHGTSTDDVREIATDAGGVITARVSRALDRMPDLARPLAMLALCDDALPETILTSDAAHNAAPLPALLATLRGVVYAPQSEHWRLAHDSVADAVLRLLSYDDRSAAVQTLVRSYAPDTLEGWLTLHGLAREYGQNGAAERLRRETVRRFPWAESLVFAHEALDAMEGESTRATRMGRGAFDPTPGAEARLAD